MSVSALVVSALGTDPKTIALVVLGAAVFGVGFFGHSTLGFVGIAVIIFGMLLPIINEIEIGPGRLQIKTVLRTRDEEFTPFMSAQRPHLQRLAFLMVGSDGAATELVDDAFTSTYVAWRHLTETRRPRFTLCRLVHLALDRSVFVIHLDQPVAQDAEGLQGDRLKTTAHVLATVHPRHRIALLLKHYEGLNEIEIAEMLDQPIEDVRSGIHFAISTVENAFALMESAER